MTKYWQTKSNTPLLGEIRTNDFIWQAEVRNDRTMTDIPREPDDRQSHPTWFARRWITDLPTVDRVLDRDKPLFCTALNKISVTKKKKTPKTNKLTNKQKKINWPQKLGRRLKDFACPHHKRKRVSQLNLICMELSVEEPHETARKWGNEPLWLEAEGWQTTARQITKTH